MLFLIFLIACIVKKLIMEYLKIIGFVIGIIYFILEIITLRMAYHPKFGKTIVRIMYFFLILVFINFILHELDK